MSKILQLQYKFVVIVIAFALAACDPPVDERFISETPATVLQTNRAKQALQLCEQNLTDFADIVRALPANGFVETTTSVFSDEEQGTRSRVFSTPNGMVAVLVATRGRQNACIVAVKGLTPQQSFDLAAPIAARFDAITNAERDNGLANNAVEAWASFTPERNIYIAAYKTFEPLGVPGAAVRIIYLPNRRS